MSSHRQLSGCGIGSVVTLCIFRALRFSLSQDSNPDLPKELSLIPSSKPRLIRRALCLVLACYCLACAQHSSLYELSKTRRYHTYNQIHKLRSLMSVSTLCVPNACCLPSEPPPPKHYSNTGRFEVSVL
jgi:hypothetical protein